MFSLRSFRRSLLRLVPSRFFFSEVAGLEPFEADAEATIADPISKKCVCELRANVFTMLCHLGIQTLPFL